MSSTSPLSRLLSRVALWLIDRLPGGVAGQSYTPATGCPCSQERDAKSSPASVQAGQPLHHHNKTMRTVALCIGHSPRDGGAEILGTNTSEYMYWERHAPIIRDMLAARGINAHICNRAEAGGTTPSYAAKACNETLADLAVELHFNAADDPAANGAECLHWYNSPKGEQAAACIQRRLVDYLAVRDRGLLKVCPDKATRDRLTKAGHRAACDRATEFFRRTTMPAVIVEPCLAGSNTEEARLLLASPNATCLAIARGIEDHFDALDQLP